MDSAKFLSRLNANGLTSVGGSDYPNFLLKTDGTGHISNDLLNGLVDITGVTGDLVVSGNLTVNGTTTTVNSTTLTIEDNIIVLNKGAIDGSVNGGVQVYRGPSLPAASILWNAGSSVWQMGLAGAETALQPLNAGLTSIGSAATTGRLYYLSAANTWSAVSVGTGLSFIGGTLASTSSATWGSIGGTLSSQTDLNTALGLKASLASPTFTGTVVLPSTTSIGTLTNTELGYLHGVTSAIQTQLAALAPTASPTFTGTVVLPSTTSIGTTTSTELGYVHGVTSAIQTQLGSLAPTASPTFTGTVVLPATTSIGTTTNTELGYVHGVTSAIQTQLDTKAALASPTFTSGITLGSGNISVSSGNVAVGNVTTEPVTQQTSISSWVPAVKFTGAYTGSKGFYAYADSAHLSGIGMQSLVGGAYASIGFYCNDQAMVVANPLTGVTITPALLASGGITVTGGTVLNGNVSGSGVSNDTTLGSNSSVLIPTQHAVKTYVDSKGSSNLMTVESAVLSEGSFNGYALTLARTDTVSTPALAISTTSLGTYTYTFSNGSPVGAPNYVFAWPGTTGAATILMDSFAFISGGSATFTFNATVAGSGLVTVGTLVQNSSFPDGYDLTQANSDYIDLTGWAALISGGTNQTLYQSITENGSTRSLTYEFFDSNINGCSGGSNTCVDCSSNDGDDATLATHIASAITDSYWAVESSNASIRFLSLLGNYGDNGQGFASVGNAPTTILATFNSDLTLDNAIIAWNAAYSGDVLLSHSANGQLTGATTAIGCDVILTWNGSASASVTTNTLGFYPNDGVGGSANTALLSTISTSLNGLGSEFTNTVDTSTANNIVLTDPAFDSDSGSCVNGGYWSGAGSFTGQVLSNTFTSGILSNIILYTSSPEVLSLYFNGNALPINIISAGVYDLKDIMTTAVQNCTVGGSATSVTCTSTAGLVAGALIYGDAGLAAGTTIASITNSTTFEITPVALSNITSATLTAQQPASYLTPDDGSIIISASVLNNPVTAYATINIP